MRPRKSLFGPVLLIALGTVLLAHNLDPEFSATQLFADYWPWILVFWGGFRLVEFLVAWLLGRRTPEPLGAGAVIIAAFLCFAGSTAHALARSQSEFIDWMVGRGTWFDLQFDHPVNLQQPIGAGQAVLIRNVEGRVRVVASEQPSLRLAGYKRIRAYSEDSAGRLDEQSRIEITSQAEHVVVQPRPMPERDWRRISYELDINLPADTPLRIEGTRGSLEIQGMAQSITISGSASVDIADARGPVRIQARRVQNITARRLASTLEVDGRARRIEAEELGGTVTVKGSTVELVRLSKLEQAARLHFSNTDVELEKLPGELEITSGSIEILDATGPLALTSRGSRTRRIRLEKIDGALTVDARRGDLELHVGDKPPAGAQIRLERGDLTVMLSPSAAFSIEARTDRGHASHEFEEAIQVEVQDRAATLRGGRGDGPLLKLETGRGDLKVERSEGSFGTPVEI